jgi:hypothetical protein
MKKSREEGVILHIGLESSNICSKIPLVLLDLFGVIFTICNVFFYIKFGPVKAQE